MANIEDEWAKEMYKNVSYLDNHPVKNFEDFIKNETGLINTSGTIVRYPFGIRAITFSSRRHFFRGEPRVYEETIPSFNRKYKDNKFQWKIIADMRIFQFYNFIRQLDAIPYWEATISDINFIALAQHYGFDTSVLDLTNDVRTALFFATCIYDSNINKYRPMNEKECNEKKYGVIFHSPNWCLDCLNGTSILQLMDRHENNQNRYLKLDNGDLDGIAFQIGVQPFMRCHKQYGYVYPMYNQISLQKNWKFEKLYIKLTTDLTNKVFKMMNEGKRVFPNEGINELGGLIEKIKTNWIFSDNDLHYAFYNQNLINDYGEFKNIVENFDYIGNKVIIQNDNVKYTIPTDLLKSINEKYNTNFIHSLLGDKIHIKPEEIEYRKMRCIEIYGKEI